ncbi:hypothetical protein EJB05_37473, partial [Eragrostis curvula]
MGHQWVGNETRVAPNIHGLGAEVVDAMNRIAMLDMELTLHERNLLSLGYKKVSAEKHASVRALIYMEVEEEERSESRLKMATELRQKV